MRDPGCRMIVVPILVPIVVDKDRDNDRDNDDCHVLISI
jgi:hypothetical protein